MKVDTDKIRIAIHRPLEVMQLLDNVEEHLMGMELMIKKLRFTVRKFRDDILEAIEKADK